MYIGQVCCLAGYSPGILFRRGETFCDERYGGLELKECGWFQFSGIYCRMVVLFRWYGFEGVQCY